MKFLRKLKLPTPKIGRRIRNVGVALLGLNAAAAGTPSLGLPEVPDSWLALANIVLAIVLALKGQATTVEEIHKDAMDTPAH